jgi:hypothetical protein
VSALVCVPTYGRACMFPTPHHMAFGCGLAYHMRQFVRNPLQARTYVPPSPSMWHADIGCARFRPSYAPICASFFYEPHSLLCHTRPHCHVCPHCHVHPSYAPSFAVRPLPPLPYAPPYSEHGPLSGTHPCSHARSLFYADPPFALPMLYMPSVRPPLIRACSYPCAPLLYKFHKVVPHSTTWIFGPSTTKRWMTAGCLGGDHTFYIHEHENVHGWGCMNVRLYVVD